MTDQDFSSSTSSWESEYEAPHVKLSAMTRLFLAAAMSLLVPIVGLIIYKWWSFLAGYAVILLITYPALSFFRRACQGYEVATGDPFPREGLALWTKILSRLSVPLCLVCAVLLAVSLS
jgi:hypothetical protein